MMTYLGTTYITPSSVKRNVNGKGNRWSIKRLHNRRCWLHNCLVEKGLEVQEGTKIETVSWDTDLQQLQRKTPYTEI
jgi:hypothetical protein